MKFKNKNGLAFNYIETCVSNYCGRRDCRDCSDCNLYKAAQPKQCRLWAKENPAEAARLMGYEVIEESDTVKPVEIDQFKNQAKPLKDWTLGEVKEYCGLRRCEECQFCSKNPSADYFCTLKNYIPATWDLTDPLRFTDEEIADAKALIRIFPDKFDAIRRCDEGDLILIRSGNWTGRVNRDILPSIRPGETVKLSDILGGD